MPTIRQVTPFLLVPDFDAALDFFSRVLGFRVQYTWENYAYIARDGAAVRLLAERTAPIADDEHARSTVYFDVDGVDALYAELKPQLDTLPAGHVAPPVDQFWHQRELNVRMPNGDWVTFAQYIGS